LEKGVWPKDFKIDIKKVVEKIGFCVFTLKAPVSSSMPAAARLSRLLVGEAKYE